MGQYRSIVNKYKPTYIDPKIRNLEKKQIAEKLIKEIRCMNPPGRFLIKEGDCWYEIGDVRACKKAGQAMREKAPDARKVLNKEKEGKKDQRSSQLSISNTSHPKCIDSTRKQTSSKNTASLLTNDRQDIQRSHQNSSS